MMLRGRRFPLGNFSQLLSCAEVPARRALHWLHPSTSGNSTVGRKLVVVDTIADLRRILREKKAGDQQQQQQQRCLGFVPTMGCLHDGHATLVRTARQHCSGPVVVSIFVNPAQFAPTEDLDRYPRTLEHDLDVCLAAGADVVFVPKVSEMYPSGIVLEKGSQIGTFVEVLGRSHQMEGSIRPHFFRGVATVVLKLFNAVQPDSVFFGQKDAQQCVVVRQMLRDLLLSDVIEMNIVETQREHDGLAMSSRNRYLSQAERAVAPVLYRALQAAATKLSSAFDIDASSNNATIHRQTLLDAANAVIADAATKAAALEPPVPVSLQYLSIADASSLVELPSLSLKKNGGVVSLDGAGSEGVIFSGAVKIGATRIIDNLWFGLKKSTSSMP